MVCGEVSQGKEVLQRVLNWEVKDLKEDDPNACVKTKLKKVGLKREDAVNRSKWRDGLRKTSAQWGVSANLVCWG